ncbi:MAG: transposase, partial [Deferribacteraceae bacterium]|nr:transposase [Deferribacteraceae bacterium]
MKFKSLSELMETYNTEDKCHQYFVSSRWSDGIRCPHCGNHEAEKKIYTFKNKLFKCGACRKQFTVRIGTFLGDTKIS